jgi:glutathione synthase/RimK-type ligase-like ATP-grasp enzyme
MSHPSKIREARWKPGQLTRAASLGLDVPRTLMTLDPAEAVEFCAQCGGQVLFKVMERPTVLDLAKGAGPNGEELRAVYAKIIDLETLKRNSLGIRNASCLFQEYVEKSFELRVTIVGERFFVAEIHSQESEFTRTDWRRGALPTLRQGSVPDDIARKCLALMKAYGLSFSAMDFIVTRDGRFVFLELNPNGQWGFIERLVPELKIADAIAERLIEGAAVCRRPIPP